MISSKDAFIQSQEAEYYQSEAYQLKQHLTIPAANIKQQDKKTTNTKTNGKS